MRGHFSRERIEEGDDGGDAAVVQRASQLHRAHDAYGAVEVVHRTVVKIGRGLRHVAQHRHAEYVAVFFLPGRGEAADIDFLRAGFRPIVLDDAEALERPAADERSVVATGAAGGDERAQTGLLRLAERAVVAAKEAALCGSKAFEIKTGREMEIVDMEIN